MGVRWGLGGVPGRVTTQEPMTGLTEFRQVEREVEEYSSDRSGRLSSETTESRFLSLPLSEG